MIYLGNTVRGAHPKEVTNADLYSLSLYPDPSVSGVRVAEVDAQQVFEAKWVAFNLCFSTTRLTD